MHSQFRTLYGIYFNFAIWTLDAIYMIQGFGLPLLIVYAFRLRLSSAMEHILNCHFHMSFTLFQLLILLFRESSEWNAFSMSSSLVKA